MTDQREDPIDVIQRKSIIRAFTVPSIVVTDIDCQIMTKKWCKGTFDVLQSDCSDVAEPDTSEVDTSIDEIFLITLPGFSTLR